MNAIRLMRSAWVKESALPLQVIGILSAVIFVLNYSLEIMIVQNLQYDRQILVVALLICLSLWALLERAILRRQQRQLPVRQLGFLLGAQFLVETLRMALLLWGPQAGVDKTYGINVIHLAPLLLLLPSYLLVFLFIARALIASYVSEIETINQALEHSNQEIQRLAANQIAESRHQEREQLLQDMHDGFGSQLASVRIMAEQGRVSTEEFPKYLQEITADLHLISDTLSQENITLETALLDMRYRLQRRFNTGKPQLHWQIQLKGIPAFEPRFILHILRILQEAFNNASRHANADNIWINAIYDTKHHTLVANVRDDGAGFPDELRPGRGVSNMQQRAREIGAQFERITHQPGTEIRLTLDLNQPQNQA